MSIMHIHACTYRSHYFAGAMHEHVHVHINSCILSILHIYIHVFIHIYVYIIQHTSTQLMYKKMRACVLWTIGKAEDI